MGDERRIKVGETADGEPVALPVEGVLTGRAAILGKSGSGKSNTVSVVIEELLEEGYSLLVVDTDGEYYGLKEEYEVLHAGADGECDIQVGKEHAERIASLALEEGVPVVLDVSGYLDEDEAAGLIRETARHLFAKEKKLKRPFLLIVEEVHEYIPEGGGMDETGRMLIKVGKRGRKHGLGIVGISQRPADVKKDFITQANWLVWHRLTWENDTKVVGRVVGGDYADAAADLDDGEAFVQRDWTDGGVARVRFDRKRTFDAGATPGLDDFERPELKSVSDSLVDDLRSISERERREADRIEELEAELAERDRQIEELEAELRSARDVSRAARQLANALSNGVGEEPFGFEERLRQKNERVRELREEVEALRGNGDGDDERADGDDDGAPLRGDRDEHAEGDDDGPGRGVDGERIDAHMARLRRRGERLAAAEGEVDGDRSPIPDDGATDVGGDTADGPVELVDLLGAETVVARVDDARRESLCNHERTWAGIAALASRGSLSLQEFARAVDAPTESVESLLAELRARSLVTRGADRRYALNADEMRRLVRERDERAALGELGRQWEVT